MPFPLGALLNRSLSPVRDPEDFRDLAKACPSSDLFVFASFHLGHTARLDLGAGTLRRHLLLTLVERCASAKCEARGC
jgi:hypothetical protein